MANNSCSNCANDCKVTRYGPNWSCGAWRSQPRKCPYLSDKGQCLFELTKAKKAKACRDIEMCSIRMNLINGQSR